jgi:L-ascorbate metabolism protein UlaG (beta-lactamase superfamily)
MNVERDSEGRLRYCGYLLKLDGSLLYHAGDTMPYGEIVAAVNAEGYPDIAFLSCNERNVYRERAGIIGNMSAREMLAFASELQAKQVVALHWDVFRVNSVFPTEITGLARRLVPELPLLVPQSARKYGEDLKGVA